MWLLFCFVRLRSSHHRDGLAVLDNHTCCARVVVASGVCCCCDAWVRTSTLGRWLGFGTEVRVMQVRDLAVSLPQHLPRLTVVIPEPPQFRNL